MKRTISAGALAVTLWAGQGLVGQQQNSIPDAPAPQPSLPAIPTIGPARGANTPAEQQPQAQAPEAPAPTPAAQNQTSSPAGQGVAEGLKLYQLPRVRVNLVEVPFTVKDSKGRLVFGLTDHDVHVYENGTLQNIRLFHADPYPLSVVLVIDQSMAYQDMAKVNAALEALQGAFAPYDEVSVYSYNNGPKRWTDFTGAQSDRLKMAVLTSRSTGRDGIVPALSGPLTQNIYKNGGADVYTDPNVNSRNGASMSNVLNAPREVHTLNDAIMAAAHELTRVGKGRRRVIYVISNGNESGSKATRKQVTTFLQTHEITLYATLVHDLPNLHIPFSGFVDRLHLPFQMQNNILPVYANATGGEVDPEFTSRGIINSLNKIAETARTQYTVFYSSSEPPLDGKYRSIDIRVARPDLTVISKPGYYPTTDAAPATAQPTPPATEATR